MIFETYLSGLVFLVSLHALTVISPGPTMALVIRNSIFNRFQGIRTVFGACLGGFFVRACAILGMAVIIQETPWLFFCIKITGGGYLLVFGALSFKKSFFEFQCVKVPSLIPLEQRPVKRVTSPLLSGFLLNSVNPLSGIQFLVVYSTIMSSMMPLVLQLSYVVILALFSFVMLGAIALFFSTARVQEYLTKWSFILNFLIGCVMIYWGIKVFCVTL